MPRHNDYRDLTTDEMIRRAGWFNGTERDWQALPHDERKNIAFAGCGCEVAYPTWSGPVECVHRGCQIRRGEKKPLSLTNAILRYEMERGWLRFGKESTEGRKRLAATIRAMRRYALQTGIYDPWQMEGGWNVMVSSALS